MKAKIIVTGGSGFLGKQICRLASEQWFDVISISRSGKPRNINDKDFIHVQWVSAEVFQPHQWRKHLARAKAVIHCIGIIEENLSQGISYEKIILGSAKLVADEARAAGVSKFVFVSAGAAAPDTPETYMKMKRAAEDYLSKTQTDLTILKPGMIYGEEKQESMEEYKIIQKLLDNPTAYPGLKENRPLHVLKVATAALECVKGVVSKSIMSVDDMDALPTR